MRTLFAIGLTVALTSMQLDAYQPTTTPPRVRGKSPEAERSPDAKANIRVDTTLVLIPVTVTNPLGKPVTGMEKENFKLFEDKVEQRIATFASQDAPMSIGILFDTSGSMGSKLQKSRQAVSQFLKIANPEDDFFLIQFNDRPELVIPFTSDVEKIQNRLMFTQSKGRTAMLDGMYLAMDQMRKAHNPRKAILIISDGGDNSSRYTSREVTNAIREADVQIYGLGIFEAEAARSRTAEELAGPALLRMFADLTGGRSFEVGNVAELPDVAEKIAIELRNQYVLGYTPLNTARNGKYRRVEVKVLPIRGLPALRAAFRTGYYAPAE